MNVLWESCLQQWTDNTEESIVNSIQGKGYQELRTFTFYSIS
jgi:hypothetical protein